MHPTSRFDSLDDDLVLHILPLLTRARDSKNAALVCKQWLALSCEVWKMRTAKCVAPDGLQWRPSLAIEIEANLERADDEENPEAEEEMQAHVERVRALPFVMGFSPAPAAAMWAKTKPTLMGGQQVYLDDDGDERDDGTWGCNESVADYSCDSNWNRGFVWGVMNFTPNRDKEVGYYKVANKPDDELDPRAIVSQFPLAVKGSKHEYDGDGKYVGFGFLGWKVAFYESPFFRGKPQLYFIGGRILRMSDGSSEESVMASLGFVRNPAVAPEDFANEARWCRLPIMEGSDPPDEKDMEGARLFDLNKGAYLNFPCFPASDDESSGQASGDESDEISIVDDEEAPPAAGELDDQ